MARYSGDIGFIENKLTAPGKWKPQTTKRHYYGDINRSIRKLEAGPGVNDNVVINNEISIIADPYATAHVFAIRFAEWQGVQWKVTNAEVLYPRIVLTLGGIYHGKS